MSENSKGPHDEQVESLVHELAENFRGEPDQLLSYVRICLREFCRQYPKSEEFLKGYFDALDRYVCGEAWTLDEALGLQRLPNSQQESLKFRKKNAVQIWLDVFDARDKIEESKKLGARKRGDKTAFQIVGKKYHRSDSSIREIFYAVDSHFKLLREPPDS